MISGCGGTDTGRAAGRSTLTVGGIGKARQLHDSPPAKRRLLTVVGIEKADISAGIELGVAASWRVTAEIYADGERIKNGRVGSFAKRWTGSAQHPPGFIVRREVDRVVISGAYGSE